MSVAQTVCSAVFVEDEMMLRLLLCMFFRKLLFLIAFLNAFLSVFLIVLVVLMLACP